MSSDEDRLRDGLKHNPFARLWGRPLPDPTDVPASKAPPATPRKKNDPASRDHAKTPPSRERVVVRRERKGHAGKTVTIAEGPGLAGHDVSLLAREAAKALGTGARVEQGALVVHGEQTERLVAWLGSRGFTSVVRGN